MKYTEFLSSALKESAEGLRIGHMIAREGLGCMYARDFAISMKLAGNIDKILREAQQKIEAEVARAEKVTNQGGWY